MDNENISAEKVHNIRHSLAHLLAIAVLEKDPKAKLGIGPVIDNGFYYDFQFSEGYTPDLKDIQKSMKKLIGRGLAFEKSEASLNEATKKFADQPYKLDLINELGGEGKTLSFYATGEFTDLCKGGHVETTKEINTDAFVLTHTAGAYWRGDEKNQMLTRIYGLAFETPEELDVYQKQQEEAKKRDHRILGAQLKLFTVSPLIGAGLPLLQPKGMLIRKQIEDYLWSLHESKGYSRVWTPHIAKEDLYVTSGHAAKFGDELFRVQGKEDKFIMKPMNCPHHMQIFADNQFSYRDMPVRYFEPATVYRDEKSGQLGGLMRVRAITQDDGHLFCTKEQIEAEVSTIVSVIKEFYTTFGMMEGYWVSLSVRGDDKSKYLGSDEVWGLAESSLEKAAKANELNYKRVEGEAAFYGPKLDFMFKDAIGRQWQLATIQCDFNLPERFDLSFTNTKGEKERPVVIHRAISGSLERFMGVMIEHFAGNFPLWLSPVQVKVLPVGEKYAEYAANVYNELLDAGIRAELDDSSDSLGKKIRTAKVEKTPYILVLGEKELESSTVTAERRDGGHLDLVPAADFITTAKTEIDSKVIW
ncbi:MAG: threonine--tRNA ligase [Candidatus Pacebacteria bacterium]|jgi:threonyl-tRNA synthetase|nr:threonine--tRNA ligase [Candidatus Paceibacterota bacterium]